MNIIITAPHSYCYRGDIRVCDRVSGFAAKTLYEMIGKDFNTEILFSNKPRSIVDMNRLESREENFRKDLRRELNIYQKGSVIVLDTHSWPNVENVWNYSLREFPRDEYPELVILNHNDIFSSNLYVYLKMQNVNVFQIQGDSIINDLLNEVRETGNMGTLLEFREDLTKTQIQNICQYIISFLKIFYKNN